MEVLPQTGEELLLFRDVRFLESLREVKEKCFSCSFPRKIGINGSVKRTMKLKRVTVSHALFSSVVLFAVRYAISRFYFLVIENNTMLVVETCRGLPLELLGAYNMEIGHECRHLFVETEVRREVWRAEDLLMAWSAPFFSDMERKI